MTGTTSGHETWLSAREAMELLDVSRSTLMKLGDRRLVTRRQVPGAAPKYLRADVERLAKQSTTEAVAS